MSLELFVVVSSLTLCCVLVVLTVLAQLQIGAGTRTRPSWNLRAAVYSWLGVCMRWHGWRASSDKTTSSVGRPPGKRARRTHRKRQRRALAKCIERQSGEPQANVTLPSRHSLGDESSSCTLDDWYLCRQREQRKTHSNSIPLQSLHFPCSGCRVVSAKRNCSYSCCARCCRTQTRSVCRAHGTGYQAAVESVEGAVQYKYLEFDLSYGHLKVCPPRITAIGTQLVSLNLSNNRLTSLPEDVGALSSLKELFLQYNNLTQLPDTVCKLHQLVEFDVKNNRLTKLPSDIGNLRRLVILNITNNCVSELPASLGKLARLEELGLHSNLLTKLPEEVCDLTSLRVVYGGENQFKNLPSRFGQLYQLQELDVSGCELEALPESLSHCVSIVRLWLSNNRLHTFPVHMGNLQQLKELHVRNNRLKYLPASMEELQLYTFTAQNNCFVDEQAAQNMCRAPRDTVPPLMEMSARAVHNYSIAWDSVSLPTCLQEMLNDPMRCSLCGGPFFQFFSSLVEFKTIGVFYRVPLCLYMCSPHLNHACNITLC